jgi:hypothetical protein
MSMRQLAHKNCQFVTIVIDAQVADLGMRSGKACNRVLSLV